VKHFASPKFWAAYEALPPSIRKLSDANYELLKHDPRHPSLQFKKVGRYWSVRIGLRWLPRAHAHISPNSGGSNQLVSDSPPSTTIAAPVT
jgi:hypothetical protein